MKTETITQFKNANGKLIASAAYRMDGSKKKFGVIYHNLDDVFVLVSSKREALDTAQRAADHSWLG